MPPPELSLPPSSRALELARPGEGLLEPSALPFVDVTATGLGTLGTGLPGGGGLEGALALSALGDTATSGALERSASRFSDSPISFLPLTSTGLVDGAPANTTSFSAVVSSLARFFDAGVCAPVPVNDGDARAAALLATYLENNAGQTLPSGFLNRLENFSPEHAPALLDLAVRHRTPPHILNRLLQGTPDQALRILNYALEQRAHPQSVITRDPTTGQFWRVETSGDILGLGAGKTVFAGRAVEVNESGALVPGGSSRDVALLMGTQAALKIPQEIGAMKAFQELGAGGVRFYGMASIDGIFGSRVPVIVANRADGDLVTNFQRDVPALEQREAAAIVARDVARLTREGFDMSGDIQFILGHDANGHPTVQWIDFEGITRGGPREGAAWDDAYRLAMARISVPLGADGFPSRNPADVLGPPH